MKKTVVFASFFLALCACKTNSSKSADEAVSAIQETGVPAVAEEEKKEDQPTSMKFDKEVHDFGTIKLNSENTCEFRVTNTGKNPLIIYNTGASCGCTTPKKPEKPILPGQSDIIEVGFKPASEGDVEKTVTVQANTEPRVQTVKIKAHVI